MTMSTRVLRVLVSSAGFGGSFSAGGRPRFLLTFSPASCPACRSVSPWSSLLRFFRLMSSSIASREPFSAASGCRERKPHPTLIAGEQGNVTVYVVHTKPICAPFVSQVAPNITWTMKTWKGRTVIDFHSKLSRSHSVELHLWFSCDSWDAQKLLNTVFMFWKWIDLLERLKHFGQQSIELKSFIKHHFVDLNTSVKLSFSTITWISC